MNHAKNHFIKPHTHRNFIRKINKTAEVLFIKNGVLRIDFYASKLNIYIVKYFKKNDIAILIQGSHGFKIIKNVHLLKLNKDPFILCLIK